MFTRRSRVRFLSLLSSLSLLLAGCGGSSSGSAAPGAASGLWYGANTNGGASGVIGVGGPGAVGPGTGVPNPFVPGGGNLANSAPVSLMIGNEAAETLVLDVGSTIALRLSVTLEDGTVVELNPELVSLQAVKTVVDGVAFTLESKDRSVATIDEQANLTGVGLGATTISVTVATANGEPITRDLPVIVGVPSFLFLASPSESGVGAIRILGILKDGRLQSLGSVDNSGRPDTVARHPNGRFIYGIGADSDQITAYRVESGTGKLVAIGDRVATVSDPYGLHFSSDGAYAYSIGRGIQSFRVASNGALQPLGTAITGAHSPYLFARVAPGGRYLYAVSWYSGAIDIYAIDPVSGALTDTGLPTALETPALYLSFHAGGKFAYAGLTSSEEISRFAVQDDGSLLELGTTPIDGQFTYRANTFATHPSKDRLYLSSLKDFYSYSIDPNSGELALLATHESTVNLGSTFGHIAFDPSQKFMYVLSQTVSRIAFFHLSDEGDFSFQELFSHYMTDAVSTENLANKKEP